MCKDEIFKEIGGRNHLNLVNNKILMFLMIKRVSKRLLERSEQQNWFRGFQEVCKDEIFKEIGGTCTCYKTKIVAKNMNCNKMMIKLVSENVLAVLQRCIMINFVVKKSSTRVQYMLQDKNCC